MANQNVSTTLTFIAVDPEDAISDEDSIILVQEPFPDPESGSFVEYALANNLDLSIDGVSATYQRYLSQCELSGSFMTRIQVIKSRPDLQYTLSITHGELGPQLQEEIDNNKRITFELKDRVNVEKNILAINSINWEGIIVDSQGSPTTPPILTIEGQYLVADKVVYGTANISFRESYEVYTATIPPRSGAEVDVDDPASLYDSTVAAIYSGRLEQLKIETPPLLGNCEGGYEITAGPQDDDEEPPPDTDPTLRCYDLEIVYNRCTGVEISRTRIPVECPETNG